MTAHASPIIAPQAVLQRAIAPCESISAAGRLSVAIVRERRAFDALEAEWNELFARCGRGAAVYQSFNWNWHWANVYLPASAACGLAILAMRREGLLVAVWPLVAHRVLGACIVEWMGSPVSQYGDVLIAPDEDARQVLALGWETIADTLGADALNLRKVRADAQVAPLLRAHQAAVTSRSEALFLDIASAADLASYETRYSSKTRKNRRRLARRLAETGELRFEHLADSAQAGDAAREAVVLRHRTLEETGRVSMALQDARYASFFAQAAGGTKPCGVRVTRILSGDRLVASAIDISAHGHRAAHIIAHDLAFEACGPGVTMVGDWVSQAFADGIGVLDLLAPAHGYKSEWADGGVGVCDYAVATSPLGRLVVVPYLARLRPRLKTAVERFVHWRAGRNARGDRVCENKA